MFVLFCPVTFELLSLIHLPSSVYWWETMDAEMKAPSPKNPECVAKDPLLSLEFVII